ARLFEDALPAVEAFISPRSWVFALIAIHEYLRRFSGDRVANHIRDVLTERRLQRCRDAKQEDWEWFEDSLSYDNARLPHALILSGSWTPNIEAREVGLRSLRCLCDLQTTPAGYFRPIGSNGFYTRGGKPAQFDQQ